MCQCQSPSSSIVQRTIDLKYGAVRRAAALRWLLANGALLAVLLLDLWKWCGVWRCYGVWAEAAAACALAASCARHALRLAPARAPPAPAALSPRQRDLLGLTHDDLDGSFVVSPDSPSRAQVAGAAGAGWLAGARRWHGAGAGAGSPPTPPSPPRAPPAHPAPRADAHEFISDASALSAFLRQQEAAAAGCGGGGGGAPLAAPPPPRAHQLSVMPDRGSGKDGPGEEDCVAGAGAAAAGAGGARVWRRLRLDPQRLTEYNLNLRLWLHVSVVGRVARELAAAGGAGALPPDHALTPFLKPFADRQYVAERITELARGGCLSAYRWNGGGRGWSAGAAGGGGGGGGGGGRPADAELLLHLLATYLDLLVPGGDFSARHLSAGPAPPAPRAHTLALHRAARDPPHYLLLLGDETVELPPGRNNLLHTLLLFLAASARASPPALCRLHLGPAGLNMLWILGR